MHLNLEQNLLEKEKFELLEKVKCSSNMVDIHYIRQKEPKGLVMRFGVHVSLLAMSHLPCY